MTKILEEGDKVPNFKAQTNSGEIALNDIKEKNIVLYFYPKDMTSGCTIEARDFSALKAEFQKKNYILAELKYHHLLAHWVILMEILYYML